MTSTATLSLPVYNLQVIAGLTNGVSVTRCLQLHGRGLELNRVKDFPVTLCVPAAHHSFALESSILLFAPTTTYFLQSRKLLCSTRNHHLSSGFPKISADSHWVLEEASFYSWKVKS
jgi:hypothetical protein